MKAMSLARYLGKMWDVYSLYTDSDVRGSAIGENRNCNDRVYVPLDLSDNTLLVERALLNPTSVCQSRSVEH